MDDQASTVEKTMKAITEEELQSLGANSDADGVWTFRDGSRGRFAPRPVAVYNDDKMTELLGFAYFVRIERVQ